LTERFQFDNPCIDEEDVQLSERLSDLLGNFALVGRISRVSLDDDLHRPVPCEPLPNLRC